MVAVPSPDDTTFRSYQRDFSKALDDEIAAMRRVGGSMTPVTNGHYLGKRGGEYLYSFTTDTEIRFPEDTPIDLHYQKEQYPGTLVSVEGFDILITIKKHIGDTVIKAKLNTEPWFLIEALKDRLSLANHSLTANRKLAEALLSASPRSVPTNDDQFSNYCDRIATETGLSLQYNQHQASAITHVLQHRVSFIWGPPGTGKTSTLGLKLICI